jgi:hypothetical protein
VRKTLTEELADLRSAQIELGYAILETGTAQFIIRCITWILKKIKRRRK